MLMQYIVSRTYINFFFRVFPQPDQLNTFAKITYNIKFTEDYWRLSTSIGEQDVNRAIFMTALQNVKHIFIRGTTSVAFTRVV